MNKLTFYLCWSSTSPASVDVLPLLVSASLVLWNHPRYDASVAARVVPFIPSNNYANAFHKVMQQFPSLRGDCSFCLGDSEKEKAESISTRPTKTTFRLLEAHWSRSYFSRKSFFFLPQSTTDCLLWMNNHKRCYIRLDDSPGTAINNTQN